VSVQEEKMQRQQETDFVSVAMPKLRMGRSFLQMSTTRIASSARKGNCSMTKTILCPKARLLFQANNIALFAINIRR